MLGVRWTRERGPPLKSRSLISESPVQKRGGKDIYILNFVLYIKFTVSDSLTKKKLLIPTSLLSSSQHIRLVRVALKRENCKLKVVR